MIKLDLSNTDRFVDIDEFENEKAKVRKKYKKLQKLGMTGWLNLPSNTSQTELDRIKNLANTIRANSAAVNFIGTGGSYLGAKSVIDFLDSHQELHGNCPEIYYSGHNLHAFDTALPGNIVRSNPNKNLVAVVISKSGTTLEPSIAFRFTKQALMETYGDDYYKHIYVITDAEKGALHDEAFLNNYQIAGEIADDIGGRYSVLTPVGLIPIAIAGGNIEAIMKGAKKQQEAGLEAAVNYAAIRNYLYKKGRTLEILASFNHRNVNIAEWWKQLFAESEGKDNKGIFPVSLTFTTDLHSLGQYIQDGDHHLFETIITESSHKDGDGKSIKIPIFEDDFDNLNRLSNKTVTELNQIAEEATIRAHCDGDTPVIKVVLPDNDPAENIGALIYFFELSCALSALTLGVDPFDQPGVEAYKNNIKKLLEE